MPCFELLADTFTNLSVSDSPEDLSDTFKTDKNISPFFEGRHQRTCIVHSVSSGKVEMFLCAACHAFTPHVNVWKR